MWVCEDVVLAFFCQESIGGGSEARNQIKLKNSIEHNLVQAAGWLRGWKGDRRHTGVRPRSQRHMEIWQSLDQFMDHRGPTSVPRLGLQSRLPLA